MIGYRISRAQLEALIEAHRPGWLQRAHQRTEGFRTAGTYGESSTIWSEVKAVYMRLQGGSKCAFCERKLEDVELGTIEQDVEHFRPKGNVNEWTPPADLTAAGVVVAVPPGGGGYYLLPYHPFNYAACCKPCNSVLKRDYFPVAGTHDPAGEDPVTLLAEEPLLIYPIGDFDDDPQTLITFRGVSPQPLTNGGLGRMRALVTIEFFALDDALRRKNLLQERARMIVAMFPFLEQAAAQPGAEPATTLLDAYTADSAPHAGCARAFRALHASDRNEAQQIFHAASQFLISTS